MSGRISRHQTFATVVKKGTSTSSTGPKDKYLKAFIDYTSNKLKAEEMFSLLFVRLEHESPIVVIKSLIIFHQILRLGELGSIILLKKRAKPFTLATFKQNIEVNDATTKFATKFGAYIHTKITTFKEYDILFERKRDALNEVLIDDKVKLIKRLQKLLKLASFCKDIRNYDTLNPVIQKAYNLIVKDCVILYSIYYDGVFSLVESFWKDKKKDRAYKIMNVFKEFRNVSKNLSTLFSRAKNFMAQVPKIPQIEDIDNEMQKYIEELSDASVSTIEKDDSSHEEIKEDNEIDEFEKFDNPHDTDSSEGNGNDDFFNNLISDIPRSLYNPFIDDLAVNTNVDNDVFQIFKGSGNSSIRITNSLGSSQN